MANIFAQPYFVKSIFLFTRLRLGPSNPVMESASALYNHPANTTGSARLAAMWAWLLATSGDTEAAREVLDSVIMGGFPP